MWVEGGDIHDELLDELGAVLAPPADLPLVPSAAEFEALAAAVSARWPGGAEAPVAGPGPVRRLLPAPGHPLRRIGSSAWRAGSVAAAIVVFSASAAAAAGGVPLPRPVRVVAYTVGLPVDSPALDDTNHHIDELKSAAKAKDLPKAEAAVQRLTNDLKKVPSQEKNEARKAVVMVATMVQPQIGTAVVSPLLPPPAPFVTTTTAPSSTTVTTQAADTGTDKPDKGSPDKTKGDTNKDKPDKPADKGEGTTATTAPPTTTTTTTGDSTTTTTAPANQTPSGTDPSSGGQGTGSDPGAGGAGSGGSDPGTTTPTSAPTTTTTTTAPAGGTSGGDPATTTTTTSSTTTTTTMPPADPGTGTNP